DEAEVEVAVAHVAADRSDEPGVDYVVPGCFDLGGQLRDRDADVGRQPLGAGTQRHVGPPDVVTRLPHAGSVIRSFAPLERRGAVILLNLPDITLLVRHRAGASMALEEQRRCPSQTNA